MEGDACLLKYDNGTYRLCQVLRNKISPSGQMQTVKVGYKEGHGLAGRKKESTLRKEIIAGVQRLVLLVPTNKVELGKTFTSHDRGVLGACCPRLPSDTAEVDNNATDVLPKGSLPLLETPMKVNDIQCEIVGFCAEIEVTILLKLLKSIMSKLKKVAMTCMLL